MLEAAANRGGLEMFKALLDEGADPNAGGRSSGSPLQGATARGKVACWTLNPMPFANILLDAQLA